MKIFKAFNKAEVFNEPSFCQSRSYYGFSWHLADNESSSPFCGYKNEMQASEITYMRLMSSLQNQHGGFYWCSACLTEAVKIMNVELPEFEIAD